MLFRYSIFAFMLLLPMLAFANEQVQVSLSSQNVNPGETIVVEILFDPGLSSSQIELSVPGVERFQVFSQSQQQRSQIINGEAETQFVYQLQIIPVEEGEFILGPVSVNLGDDELIDDEDFKVTVGSPVPPLNTSVLPESLDITEQAETETANEVLPKPEIRPLRGYSPPAALLALGVILFFMIFYWLLRKYFFPYKDPVQREIPKHILDAKRKFELYFQKLEHVHEDLGTQEFSRKLDLGIRKIMNLEGYTLAQTGTLKEFKKLEDFKEHELFGVFSENYKYEFSSQELDVEKRRNYLTQVIKYVRNIGE